MKLNELETDENPRKTKRSNLAPVQVIQENSKNSEKSSISLNSSRANSSKGEFPFCRSTGWAVLVSNSNLSISLLNGSVNQSANSISSSTTPSKSSEAKMRRSNSMKGRISNKKISFFFGFSLMIFQFQHFHENFEPLQFLSLAIAKVILTKHKWSSATFLLNKLIDTNKQKRQQGEHFFIKISNFNFLFLTRSFAARLLLAWPCRSQKINLLYFLKLNYIFRSYVKR